MSILQILKIVAAVGTIIAGLPALIRPPSVYGFTGLSVLGVRGTSEIRAILGGLLIGIGAAPLILSKPAAYQTLGIAYLAIAVARLFSILVDRSYASSNLISLAVEIVFGVILVL
jgi:hypothetical protein